MTRTKAIIAVFGSKETGKFPVARHMGIAITRSGHILLTGGTGEVTGLVKDEAIIGAGEALANGWAAPWIGVERGEPPTVPSFTSDPGSGAITIQTDLNHKRNCLEACLCDAAVVLEGGAKTHGTTSEAVFTLSLGKPVAFIGKTWNKYGIGDIAAPAKPVDFNSMVADAFRAVGQLQSSDAPLDSLFDKQKVLERLSKSASYKWYPDPSSRAEALAVVADALGWLQGSISGSNRGAFPDIPRYAGVAAKYDDWVKNV